jgi:hypothetical protein
MGHYQHQNEMATPSKDGTPQKQVGKKSVQQLK